jgi:glycine/D-amino acid oxidase-like deaminating enzyme
MVHRPDVLVVGAGIVGAACAHELARAGLSVHVLDARLGGATNAGMGHLVVMDDNAAELALSALSLDVWHDWGPRMNADAPRCAYVMPGTLWIAADAEEMEEAQRKHARLRAAGLECELLGAPALALAEPALRPGLAGALRVDGDGWVYAPDAAEWLLRSAAPAIVVEHARVQSIDAKGVMLADGGRRDAGAVLLAAGIQATQLCPELPIRPKKGHLAITDRYPGTVKHQLVELGYVKSAHHGSGTSVAFNVQPRPTGQLFIGSSRQFDTTDPAVEPAILGRMLDRAIGYLPVLAECNAIRTWTGFRAATPDSLPIIGPHPWRRNLWLAVGHEGLGVTTAPATARLLAAQLTGSTLPLDAQPYVPTRFDLRGAACT